jgi:competence protein ComEC
MRLPFLPDLEAGNDSRSAGSAGLTGCFVPACALALVLAGTVAFVGAESLRPATKDAGAARASLPSGAASPSARTAAKRVAVAQSKDLKIFFVDVEGGQSTLFVTPAGDSLLVDTGWPDNNGRDANRIVAVAKKAGIRKIDYVVITHFHTDHVGGVPQLVARIPVGTFIDHGPNRQADDAVTEQGYEAYQKVLATGKYKHILAKPGEVLPVRGMHVEVVSADGVTIAKPLPGAGESNASACAASPKYPVDQTENKRSVGMVITFGKLRILDLGDLTHDEEVKLMCPVNKLGKINIYIVSHHGWDQSSSPALVWGIAPRVAIMDNGAKKGGSPSVWDIIEKSPGLENLWQLHYSDEGASKHNVAPEYIANLDGPDAGHYIELTANPGGSFSVFNSRTDKTKEYASQ